MNMRFDGRVAIVTGGGKGLGRAHALGLAERGARVVVNDVGAARDGRGASTEVAEQVGAEIRAIGGEAFAHAADVTRMDEVESMVGEAMARWGRIDILVCNAGILRDRSFLKMELRDFRAVLDVHLMGSVHCAKAVWEVMRQQGYGRIALTTSSSGLYGNFGQANYGAAKMALVGLMNVLVLEGQKYDIRVNCLCPVAATRMTADVLSPQALALLTPASVTPGLLYLVSEAAPNRTILAAGAGTFACTSIQDSAGLHLPTEQRTPEEIKARWEEVRGGADRLEFPTGREQTQSFLSRAVGEPR